MSLDVTPTNPYRYHPPLNTDPLSWILCECKDCFVEFATQVPNAVENYLTGKPYYNTCPDAATSEGTFTCACGGKGIVVGGVLQTALMKRFRMEPGAKRDIQNKTR